jgi:alcohol dehydrogenase class IV
VRLIDPRHPFSWQDGERMIVFGRDTFARAGELLGSGYTLLSTGRALSGATGLTDAAAAIHEVGPGRVDERAAELRRSVGGELLVAYGGGRVIDVAKALAAADPPRRVAAIPTTLSGAEMTAIHRHAAHVSPGSPRVRPAIVINDPKLSASQPLVELARSAANALGHATESMLTPLANPVTTLAALQAARLIAGAIGLSSGSDAVQDPDRDALALGALLAGYAIGSGGYGLHHVLAQTLARFGGVSHGAANAVILPHSMAALERRFPQHIVNLGEALGAEPIAAAARLADLGEAATLRRLGVTRDQLERCVEEAAARPELNMTPPAADASEVAALYRAAY